jgi:chromosome segregation ATPase
MLAKRRMTAPGVRAFFDQHKHDNEGEGGVRGQSLADLARLLQQDATSPPHDTESEGSGRTAEPPVTRITTQRSLHNPIDDVDFTVLDKQQADPPLKSTQLTNRQQSQRPAGPVRATSDFRDANDDLDLDDPSSVKELRALLQNERQANRGYAKAIKTLQGVLEKKNDDLRVMEEKIHEADDEIRQLTEALEERETDVERLRDKQQEHQAHAASNSELEERVIQLADQLRDKHAETQALQRELQNSRHRISDLEAKTRKDSDEAQEFLRTLEKVQQVVDRKNDEIQALEQRINDSESSRRKLLSEQLAADKVNKAQLEQVQQALKDRNRELVALEQQLQQHAAEKALAVSDLGSKDIHVKQAKAIIDELKAELAEKQALLDKKESDELKSAREQARLEHKLAACNAEIDNLKKKIAEQDDELHAHSRQRDNLAVEAQFQRQQSVQMESAAKTLMDDIDAGTQKVAELEQLLNTTRQHHKALSSELEIRTPRACL